MIRTKQASGKFARSAEAALWLIAVTCLICCAIGAADAKGARSQAEKIVVQTSTEAITSLKAGEVIGRLEISDVGLAVPILEDYDAQTLLRGAGHVPGTAVPGGLGNFVLAGHRDTFFRPLRRVSAGMAIGVITGTGRWRYIVDRTEIVLPEQVSVLDIGDVPEMTLITCYPFEFIGTAPKRFIVHARLLSVDRS